MNRHFQFYILCIFLSLACLLAIAQEKKFSLQDCVDFAFQKNKEVVGAEIDRQIDILNSKQSLTNYLPKLSLDYTFNDALKLQTLVFGGREIQIGSKYSSGVVFNFDNMLSPEVFTAVRLFKLQKMISALNVDQSKENVVSTIYTLYHSYLVYHNLTESTKKIVETIGANRNDLQKKYENGLIPELEVSRLDLALIQAENQVKAIEKLLFYTLNSLKAVMGMEPNAVLELKEKIGASLSYIAEGEYDKNILENNLSLQLLDTYKKVSESNILRQKLLLLPSVKVSLVTAYDFYNDSFRSLYGNSFDRSVLGISFNIPIFSGGTKFINLKKAKLDLEKAKNEIFHTRNNLNVEYDNLLHGYRVAKNKLTAEDKALELAKEILRQTKLKYDLGLASSFEYVTSQKDFLSQQNTYYNTLLEVLQAKISLDKLSGKYNFN